MRIDEITQDIKTSKASKRVGRGPGSGSGKTSGRGTKGQKSRTGGSIPKRFEGGQTPLVKRIPKRKGFKAIKRPKVFIINLHHLGLYLDKDHKLSINTLKEKGYIKGNEMVKLLGSTKLTDKVEVEAHKVSKGAKQAIESNGGKITLIK